jgi:AsmA protein
VAGRARLASRSFASALRFDHIRMTLDWRQFDAPAKLSGTTRIEEEPAELAVWIAKPADLLRGNPSNLMLRLASATGTLWTSGSVASMPRLHYTGRIAASAVSLRRLIGIFGYTLPVPAPLHDMRVVGTATVAANTASFSNLRLRVDGNDFEGTLAMQRGDQKPNLSGTLATNRLDLTPLLTESGPLLESDRRWNAQPFDLTGIDSTDVDLRISAAQVQLAGFALQDAAFSLMSKNGGVELAVPEAKTFGGLLKARFTMAAEANRLDFNGNASVSNFDLGAFAKANSSQALKLTGTMAGTANLQASGTSFSALFHHLDGQADVTLRNGVIAGLDLMQTLQEQVHPQAIKADFGGGHTPFDDAHCGLHIVDGRASIENGLLKTAGATFAFGGSADFGERMLDIKARANETHAAGGVAPNPQDDGALFDLRGSWDDLHVIPAL